MVAMAVDRHAHGDLPSSRKEALKVGVPMYYTGRLCIHGHQAPRHTHSGTCVTCNENDSVARKARGDAPKTDAKRPRELSEAERSFILNYLTTGSRVAAVRVAYPDEHDPAALANRLLHRTSVQAELDRLRADIRERTGYGVQQAVVELEGAIALAIQSENATAMVRAIEMKSRLHGLIVDRSQAKVEFAGRIDILAAMQRADAWRSSRVIDAEVIEATPARALPAQAGGDAMPSMPIDQREPVTVEHDGAINPFD
ncbi:MAG: hypothetical protein KIS79_12760 [Burkholderiales bacterium]|nr:hypothetical protein [Burkholderiales bacterium]